MDRDDVDLESSMFPFTNLDWVLRVGSRFTSPISPKLLISRSEYGTDACSCGSTDYVQKGILRCGN